MPDCPFGLEAGGANRAVAVFGAAVPEPPRLYMRLDCQERQVGGVDLAADKKIELPDYKVVSIEGEAHAQTFKMECVIEKLHITTVGEGASRRVAEQQAAQLALEAIK